MPSWWGDALNVCQAAWRGAPFVVGVVADDRRRHQAILRGQLPDATGLADRWIRLAHDMLRVG
jgi:hypothetical protein